MKLILVRHGETDKNRKHINMGQTECPLDARGKAQVNKLAKRLKSEHIDAIFISDLRRTRQTAAPIIKLHPEAKIVYTNKLREQELGIFDGKPYGSLTAAAKEAGIKRLYYKPKHGESILEMSKRVNSFFKSIFRKYKDKTVLLVTHGGPIVNLLLNLLHKPDSSYKRYGTDNASISIVRICSKPRLVRLNDTDHL